MNMLNHYGLFLRKKLELHAQRDAKMKASGILAAFEIAIQGAIATGKAEDIQRLESDLDSLLRVNLDQKTVDAIKADLIKIFGFDRISDDAVTIARRVLERRSVNGLSEADMVKGIISDLDDDRFGSDERKALGSALLKYEGRAEGVRP